ncbi:hypothetical protein BKP35_12130 [Anaerobacillus arseniciselenatis]|uniref:MotA/TolQ/ExbB proton channel domain-containing protein n=1 Tax=Anaerobacillus arseniciselenatis TaxID=85682 RepID=A0A1S2LGP7_9BACI|nr:hypothetical protein [Anaerobacillus arseniciselenatis]OIJ11484.1 hypothetical protein BKP35_12130 [Anaerobacillus arseniciselenatis]
MKEKVLIIFFRYIFPMLILFLMSYISMFLSFGGYILVSSIYIVLNYYLIVYIFQFGYSSKIKSKNSLYTWLDSLEGGTDLLNQLFSKSLKSKDVLVNLEQAYLTLNHYTKYDHKKLKLLRGYYKVLSEEGPLDKFYSTVHAVIIGVAIWGINKGIVLEIARYSGDTRIIGVEPNFITILNIITFFTIGILFTSVIIKDYYLGKKRKKLIIEIIDICIEENKS